MKHPLLFALLLLLSANKCQQNGPTMADLLNTRWQFQTVNGKPLNLPEETERPWLQLTDDGVQGFGGCNRMMGGYELKDAALKFSGVATTRMYCERTQVMENAITQALSNVDNYTFKDGVVSLRQGNTVLATLVAGEAKGE